jgi:uncharacterized membrane-anchored protein
MRNWTNTARQWLATLTCLTLLGAGTQALAADTAEATPDPRQAAMNSAFKAAQAVQIKGPSEVKLRDQATLKLAAGYVWVPEPAAGQLMKAMGNHPDERELGLIFPAADNQNWMIVATYDKSGYIKDDEAKNWNVDDLFKSLKEGTEASNEQRRKEGFGELDIVGWVEKPTYTEGSHQLIWSISTREKGAPADAPMSINYNTYALGREGYITLDMITGLQDIGQDKQHVQTLLAALFFDAGKRYADFDSSTDKVAEYGLAALVGGLAAKKIGMFALAAGLFAKFAKVIVLGVAGVGAVFTKFFKKKDQA